MSLQIRTLVSGTYKYLDLFDDEDILMSFSVGEIQDITSKNSSYSKSFTLPGTKNNNEIFNYFYDVNSVPLDFDPNDKFDAIISWDGYEILVGNIRLDGVSIQGEDFTYQITFYNQVGNLSANIGDKFLRQTDLSHLSHPFSREVIQQSNVDYNLYPLTPTGATSYSFQNGKTMWGLYNIGYSYSGNSPSPQLDITPLVEFTPLSGDSYEAQFGYFDFVDTPVRDYYFKPTLQIKELYSSIVRDAGYEIESNFFNTSYFERFYLPLKFLDESIYPKNAIIPCYAYSNTGLTFGIGTSISTNPSINVECNTLGWSATSDTLIVGYEFAGSYTFRFTFTVQPTEPSCNFLTGIYPFVRLNFDTPVSSATTLYSTSICDNNELTISFDRQFTITGASDLQFIFYGQYINIPSFTFELIEGPRFILSGQTIDYALEFPDNDYKQIDFITSINRYFNLVVVPSPEKSNTLIIEPIVDYFGKGEVLDWTSKVDYNQLQSLAPTTSLINGTLDFEFRLDQDYANQDFKTAANKVFGTDKINLNIPYKNSTTKFDYIFSSPVDITINTAQSSYLTLSSFSKVKTLDVTGSTLQQFQPFKILPRVVFRGLTLPYDNYGLPPSPPDVVPIGQVWWANSLQEGTFAQLWFTNINRFTTYPFNYSGFSHYINFNGEDQTTIQPREFAFVADDLYDIYYKDYIDDLISPENKIYKVKIYLTPNDVKSLLYNEKILIKNSLFRINKIDNFNLLEPAICDLELVKLTKDYKPRGILYYTLATCDGSDIRYSNSDLNYNLYAFIGTFVTLYDDDLNYLGCYEVIQGEYNESHNYQHYYLDFYQEFIGVPLHVSGYEDCECSQTTPFIVVQDGSVVPPAPSPSPSPTPNPTPTPTPVPPTNTYITFTSNTASQTTYTYNDVPIGGAGLIVVSTHTEAAAPRTLTSASINGVSSTIASQIVSGSGAQATTTGIFYLRVTGGTTANISLTYSGEGLRNGIGVWRIQNNISDTPMQSQTEALNTGTGLTITFTGLSTNNIGICAQTNGTDTTPITWSGATEDYDTSLSAGTTRMSGADFITSSSGNRTVSTSHASSTQPIGLVGVVWS